jgi:regulator of protease activity HflC (stomatin/prohibitin superfamily)
MNGDGPTSPGGGPPGAPHRPASVNLRTGAPGPGGPGDSLDPANQSLAEALRIISRILSATMAVLAVLFALSGFQSIQEGERGISLLFGKVTGRDLRPGFQFSFPRPLGELIRVSTGVRQQDIDAAFWPFMTDGEKRQSIEQLAAKPSLNPRNDGSVITSDEALAHTRWSVVYSRADIEAYSRNILPDQEELIVRAAVERGVVQAVAQTRIDALLKQSAGDEGSVAARASQIAQQTLDDMSSGLHIDQLQLRDKMPPLRVRDSFARVQAAESKRAQSRQDALAERDRILNGVAGGAAPYLAEQIERYEEAITLEDEGAQADILNTINAMLEGREVVVNRADGSTETVGNVVSGEVTSVLADAAQYRSSIAGRTQAQYLEFKAKLEQFQTNPMVMVSRDWTDAFAQFLAQGNVQVVWVPPGVFELDVLINSDPDIVKEQLRAENRQKGLDSEAERERLRQEERLRTDKERQILEAR